MFVAVLIFKYINLLVKLIRLESFFASKAFKIIICLSVFKLNYLCKIGNKIQWQYSQHQISTISISFIARNHSKVKYNHRHVNIIFFIFLLGNTLYVTHNHWTRDHLRTRRLHCASYVVHRTLVFWQLILARIVTGTWKIRQRLIIKCLI